MTTKEAVHLIIILVLVIALLFFYEMNRQYRYTLSLYEAQKYSDGVIFYGREDGATGFRKFGEGGVTMQDLFFGEEYTDGERRLILKGFCEN